MRAAKTLVSLMLAGALTLSPALAADVSDKFPAENSYSAAFYPDVPSGAWYADAAKVCYETGIMLGTQVGFAPDNTVTVAETAVISARLAGAVNGKEVPAGENWYKPSVDLLTGLGVAVPSDLFAPATREEFFSMLAAVLPADYTAAVNSITALPDTDSSEVLRFYNAGILTGTDAYGTFNGGGVLTRKEAAAMIARVVRPELRKEFTLRSKPAEAEKPVEKPSYQEELGATMALKVNGQEVPMDQYVGWLNRAVDQFRLMLRQNNMTLDWSENYGVDDLPGYFKDQAKSAAISYVLRQQKARQLGCEISQLAQKLYPSPTRDQLEGYLDSLGYLGAKHILIQTVNPQTGEAVREDAAALEAANILLDAINQQPTEEMFDNLVSVYGEDPGMKQTPQGYLFTSGEMVAEFENAVKGLQIGAYTKTPVKSSYGYHIIWRVDPMELVAEEDLTEAYRSAMLSTLVNTWMTEATVTVNDALIDKVNVQATYEAYLKEAQG